MPGHSRRLAGPRGRRGPADHPGGPAADAGRLASCCPSGPPCIGALAPTAPFERLTVRELHARAAVPPQLARSGRRAELLQALAATAG
jgi:hypothetical protein